MNEKFILLRQFAVILKEISTVSFGFLSNNFASLPSKSTYNISSQRIVVIFTYYAQAPFTHLIQARHEASTQRENPSTTKYSIHHKRSNGAHVEACLPARGHPISCSVVRWLIRPRTVRSTTCVIENISRVIREMSTCWAIRVESAAACQMQVDASGPAALAATLISNRCREGRLRRSPPLHPARSL